MYETLAILYTNPSLRLAFDSSGRPWELAALSFGNGSRYLVIHAMPARKSVIAKMQRRLK